MPERWWGTAPEAVKHLRKAASCQLAAMGCLQQSNPVTPLSVFLALVPCPFIESAWRSWEPLMSFTKYIFA